MNNSFPLFSCSVKFGKGSLVLFTNCGEDEDLGDKRFCISCEEEQPDGKVYNIQACVGDNTVSGGNIYYTEATLQLWADNHEGECNRD
jgi:hypothetical protein